MLFAANRVRHRVGIPRTVPLTAWALAEYQGMQVPGSPMRPGTSRPPLVALTDGLLWLSAGGDTRVFRIEDMVMVSGSALLSGAMRVDFMDGAPLVVALADCGELITALANELHEYDNSLQLEAEEALGLPGCSADLLEDARRAHQRAEQLLGIAGDDRLLRTLAEGYAVDEQELLRDAQVEVLRNLREALLASLTGASGFNVGRRSAHDHRLCNGDGDLLLPVKARGSGPGVSRMWVQGVPRMCRQ